MKKLILFIFSVVVLLLPLTAQKNSFVWNEQFGGKGKEQILDMILASNGQLIAVGAFTPAKGKKKEGFLLVVDHLTGKQKQIKTFPRQGDCVFESVAQTNDGGFLIAGYTKRKQKNGLFFKVDEYGSKIWESMLGTKSDNHIRSILSFDNDRYLLAGTDSKGIFLSLFQEQNLIWERHFLNDDWGVLKSIIPTHDKGFIITGTTSKTISKSKPNIKLAKLNRHGELLWQKEFGGKRREEPASVVATADGGYALAATTWSKGNGNSDMWLIKTDTSGNLLWEHTFGGRAEDIGYDITETFDGDLVLVGQTRSHRSGTRTSNLMAIKVGPDGNLQWERNYGNEGEDIGTCVLQTFNGHLAIAGTGTSKKIEKNNAWIFCVEDDAFASGGEKSQLNLAFKPIQLHDKNKDKQLNPNERAYFSFEISNKGDIPIRNIQVTTSALNKVPGLHFWDKVYAASLKKGMHKLVYLPLIANEELASGEITLNVEIKNFKKLLAHFQTTIPCRKKLSNIPITVTIPNYSEGQIINQVEEFTLLRVNIISESPIDKTNIVTYKNSVPLEGARDDQLELEGGPQGAVYHYEYNNPIRLTEGENIFEVAVVKDGQSVKSTKYIVNYSPRKPNLHILAIGVAHDNLAYTQYDATDFAAAYLHQSGEGKLFNQVFTTVLTEKLLTTKIEIKKAFRQLLNSFQYPDHPSKIYPKDVVIVFISSHGMIYKNRFKLLPSDFSSNFEEETTIDFDKDILEYLDQIHCKKMILIDACHSGIDGGKAPSNADLSKKLSELMAKQEGTVSLMSCQKSELSYEDKSWENGAFTEALLEGFQDQKVNINGKIYRPDMDNDDILTINELYKFLLARVPQLIRTQKPNAPTQQTPVIKTHRLPEGFGRDDAIFVF